MVFISGSKFFLLSNKHFQVFYPDYGPKVQTIIRQKCTSEFVNYQAHNATCTQEWIDFRWGLNTVDCGGYILLNCILDAMPETAKSDMSSAGTFLGLLPVILAMIGSTTADVGLLGLRRPVLAAILGLASPAVNPMRFIDWKDPFEVIRLHKRPVKAISQSKWCRVFQSMIEYLLAILALVNLIRVAVDLTRKAIVGNQPNRDYQTMVWALWAFALHLAGYISLLWRVRLVTPRSNQSHKGNNLRAYFYSWFLDAITPSACQSHATISVKPETNKFIGLAWAASLATVVHIAYGSQNFSQMLFLSGGEGMIVLCRCMASVVLCRIILVYELQGMGRTVEIREHGAREIESHGAVDMFGSQQHGGGGFENESGIALVKTSYQSVSGHDGA